MKVTNIKLQYPENIDEMEVVITAKRTQQNIQEVIKNKEIIEKGKILNVEIKQHRKRRSLDANAYCWVLSQKIAEIIGNTKEFVYKEMIKRVGQFEIIPIRDEALDRWIEAWESKGLGWQSEVMRDSKIEGYTNTINYFGSSVYNSKEMFILINEIVTQAEELGIETIPENEINSLIEAWGKGD